MALASGRALAGIGVRQVSPAALVTAHSWWVSAAVSTILPPLPKVVSTTGPLESPKVCLMTTICEVGKFSVSVSRLELVTWTR